MRPLDKLWSLIQWADPVEQRSALSNPSSALREGLIGQTSPSGALVNLETSLTIPAFYQGVRLLSQSLAVLPLSLRKPRAGGGSDVDQSHAVHRAIAIKPNGFQTPFAFWSSRIANAVARGAGYAQVVRSKNREVAELIPLDTGRFRAVVEDTGELVHVYARPDGSSRIFRAGELLRIEGLSFDGIHPLSPLASHRRSLGLAIDAADSASAFYGNGARPGMTITLPPELKLDEEALKQLKLDLSAQFSNSGNHYKTMLLEHGVTVANIGLNPEDMQSLAMMGLSVRDIARILNIPAHMLADLENATFSNIEHQGQEWVTYSLLPWIVNIEQAIVRDLLEGPEQEAYQAKMAVQALLRGDATTRAAYYSSLTQNGLATTNEVRAWEDMNPSDEPNADKLRVQSALVPLENLGDVAVAPAPVPPIQNGDKSSEERSIHIHNHTGATPVPVETRDHAEGHRARLDYQDGQKDALTAGATAVLVQELKGVRSIIARGEDPANTRIALEEFYRDHREEVGKVLRPYLRDFAMGSADAAARELGEDFSPDANFEAFVLNITDARAAKWSGSSRNQLLELSQGEAHLDALAQRADEWEQKRAAKFAEREATQTGSAITISTWTALGVTNYAWRNRGAGCKACRAFEGRVISSRGGRFASVGDVLEQAEGTPDIKVQHDLKHPGLHRNCDCYVSPERG
jgi:HK97 family phage portal protein